VVVVSAKVRGGGARLGPGCRRARQPLQPPALEAHTAASLPSPCSLSFPVLDSPITFPPPQVESELNEMPEEEAREWLEMLGVTDGGLAALVRATYKTLGLQTYFTTGG
jgi:hypothetical protein